MKENKKYKIKTWKDLYIATYAVNVDIIIYDELPLLKEWWKKSGNDPEILEKYTEMSALCLEVNASQYVLFFKRDRLSVDTIVHEVTHVRQNLFSNIGTYYSGLTFVPVPIMEKEAYFTGMLVQQVYNRVKPYLSTFDDFIMIKKQMKNERPQRELETI